MLLALMILYSTATLCCIMQYSKKLCARVSVFSRLKNIACIKKHFLNEKQSKKSTQARNSNSINTGRFRYCDDNDYILRLSRLEPARELQYNAPEFNIRPKVRESVMMGEIYIYIYSLVSYSLKQTSNNKYTNNSFSLSSILLCTAQSTVYLYYNSTAIL